MLNVFGDMRVEEKRLVKQRKRGLYLKTTFVTYYSIQVKYKYEYVLMTDKRGVVPNMLMMIISGMWDFR